MIGVFKGSGQLVVKTDAFISKGSQYFITLLLALSAVRAGVHD
jgi:hypothetical protein